MRSILTVLTVLTLAATACSGDDPVAQTPDDPGDGTEPVVTIDDGTIVLTGGLSGFDSCELLLDHLRTEGAERVGPYGFDGGPWYGGPIPFEGEFAIEEDTVADFDEAGGDDGSTATTTPSSVDLVEGVDFSGTNVQESGVDEADIVKTDGERVFVVSGGELVVVDVASREVIGSTALPAGHRAELFLHGDELLYLTQTWGGDDGPWPVEPFGGAALDIAFPVDTGQTVITRVSMADGEPVVMASLVVEGEYVSSRAVDGTARVVLRSNPQYRFPFVYPQSEAGEERAEEANRDALLDSELSDWLPGYASIDADGDVTDEGLFPACDQVHAPDDFSGFGVLMVLSVDVDGALDPGEATAVLAPGDVVYASPESLYVATQAWMEPVPVDEQETFDADDWQALWNDRRTALHRFELSRDGAAYTASGTVPGDVRDSFSLSEHEGHLRVVTTTGETWDETSESFVRVLRETDGALVEVGSVGDLGNGEAVQSVRFVGDTGYVVTFRQVDPFYTVDLSDPENPQVLGELKIPGFSSYLHPIGDGLVLGVGSDADQSGRVTGAKVSLFDVTDLANPQEVAVWTAPDGWNDVGWDHRSFLWWGAEDLAVIPVEVWSEGWTGAVVLRVADGEITEVGRIDHLDADEQPGQSDCREFEPQDLPDGGEGDISTEFEAMVVEGWATVLVCDGDAQGGLTGAECWDEPWVLEDAERAGVTFAEDEWVQICYPGEETSSRRIVRTMVLPGDELWSMSTRYGDLSGRETARLQINELVSLERLGVVAA